MERHKSLSKNDKPAFDIIESFTSVFNDIETHGVNPGLNFAKGWLCPLYKKKDRTDISNYRPITVLNTDYKMLTRIIKAPTV